MGLRKGIAGVVVGDNHSSGNCSAPVCAYDGRGLLGKVIDPNAFLVQVRDWGT
jgi:hypothetical protein